MSKHHMQGFTLPELMITLSVAAILVTLATPSYLNFIQKNNALVLANQLVSDLNTARVNALSTGAQVSLCPINDSTASTCGNETKWSNGWVVFKDPNNQFTFNSTTLLHESNYTSTTGVTYTVSPSNISQVGYNALGALSTTPFSVTIRPNSCSGSQAQLVSVSSSGRVSKEATGC
jgi:type IV fimbrial biogenesis protein FimT